MQKPQSDDQKNLLLAIILSVGVLLAWIVLYAGPKQEQERQKRLAETQLQQQQTTTPAAATTGQPPAGGAVTAGAPPLPGQAAATATPVPPPVSAVLGRAQALALSPRIAVETPALKGSIALQGGRIDDLQLVRYRVAADPKSDSVTLFSPASAPEPYFAEYGWTTAPGTTAPVPGPTTVWQAPAGARLTPTTPVKLTWDNGAGLVFTRTISVDPNFMFKIVDEVENRTSAAVTLFPYARIFRYGTPKVEGFFIQHEGIIGVTGDKGLQEITYATLQGEGGAKSFEKITGGWLGFTDKYWAATLIPDQSATYRANLFSPNPKRTAQVKESFQADYLLNAVETPAGGRSVVTGHLFAGAKDVGLVETYLASMNIAKFDLLIDWGWFYFITKPLYHMIHWLYTVLGNFGLAILAVTVIVKAAFFWFANKSYESMAKMKKLQPEMEKIRERFKDDKMRQQQEMMTLYKTEKINPLAGCLPVLIQIPVFFALYKVLFISLEMRHAPFYGWITDLSAPDPTSIFNLFGLLPYTVPAFLLIGVWPIIMGITMWLQMQLNPQQPDPIQQQIFNWMPVMFTFLLATFPAGLVIYWAWNNVLSLAQQYLIMKRQGVDVPLVENLRKSVGALTGLVKRGEKAKS